MQLERPRVSLRRQHLAAAGVDVNDPESRRVLLADHGDYSDTWREEVISRVLRMGRTNLAVAFETEQDRLIGTGWYLHLVGAHVCISASQRSRIFLVRRVAELDHRDLLRVGPRLAGLHAREHERIGRHRNDYDTLTRIGNGRHHKITFRCLMDEACERGRELKPPGELPARSPHLREAKRLRVASVRASRDPVDQCLVLKREVNGHVLDGLAGQCIADHARPKLSGDFLLILGRQGQHDAVGVCGSRDQQQDTERYRYERSQCIFLIEGHSPTLKRHAEHQLST